MDERTRQAYERRAGEYASRDHGVPSPLLRYFHIAFPRQGQAEPRILDIGAGSGRELMALVSEKFDAYGIEPVDGLRQAAVERHPELSSRMKEGELPGLGVVPGVLYDGVVCSAVLQHVRRQRLFDAVLDIRDVLRTGGRALVAVPAARPDIDPEGRDPEGRLFSGVTADELQLLFERVGFVPIARWVDDDALSRPGHRWTTLLLERSAGEGTRAIDELATVIGVRERKVATYKLALLRALTDIAMTEAHRVRFRDDGRIAVPLEAISERWVHYYWPLFAAKDFLPQMNDEGTRKQHLLGFSAELRDVMDHFHKQLGEYVFDARMGFPTSKEAAAKSRKLIAVMGRVIKAGPVTYAGGAMGKRLFASEGRDVLVGGGLWRELSLLGPWIADSIVLRWAELTSRLSKGEVPPGKVLDYLITEPAGDRDTGLVRAALLAQPTPPRCVWTSRKLSPKELHIDHVLPWSMWRNNDLWNLVPTADSVNLSKSDALPSRSLVRARHQAFLETWEIVAVAAPQRFQREAEAQLGVRVDEAVRDQWFESLFDVMAESIEATRLQRGIEAWEPHEVA